MSEGIGDVIFKYSQKRQEADAVLLRKLAQFGYGINDILIVAGHNYVSGKDWEHTYFVTRIDLKNGRPWWYGHKMLKNRCRGTHEHSIGDIKMVRRL